MNISPMEQSNALLPMATSFAVCALVASDV